MRDALNVCILAVVSIQLPLHDSTSEKPSPLIVSSLTLVVSRNVDEHVVEDTYRASLTHMGALGDRDFAGVTARLVLPFTLPQPDVLEILDDTLEFGAVRARQTV